PGGAAFLRAGTAAASPSSLGGIDSPAASALASACGPVPVGRAPFLYRAGRRGAACAVVAAAGRVAGRGAAGTGSARGPAWRADDARLPRGETRPDPRRGGARRHRGGQSCGAETCALAARRRSHAAPAGVARG